MPLDTTSYPLSLLRLDGRRWNELRAVHGQISTQAAADGSSYFELGNTKVLCTVTGPEERRGGGGGQGGSTSQEAQIVVDVNVAGFSGVDRRRRARNDKRTSEMQHTIQQAFAATLLTAQYPRSSIAISLHVLAADGSVLAACLNAASLALADAGVPMVDYVVACSAGSAASYGANDEQADPLIDLNGTEELELPGLTVATVGASDKVCVLVMESRCQLARVEGMLAVGIDGCKRVKGILDAVVKGYGRGLLERSAALG